MFSKLHFNFSSAPPSFTKQICGPTKNRKKKRNVSAASLSFMLLFVST